MSERTVQGLAAIAAMFARARNEQRAAFLPFFTVGFPTYETSLDVLTALAELDVDGFEIGIPFSDPLADGAVIQEATQVALNNGTTVKKCLQAVRELRARGVRQPILLFSYLNPILAYGLERMVEDAHAAGADGFIIPDLPPEEGSALDAACARAQMALVYFVAPTSSPERIALASQHATGFIYVVSITGVTGARTELPPDLLAFIQRVRSGTSKPLVLGFGISTPEHARQMNGLVDGFIVASALIRLGKEGVEPVRALAASLRAALASQEKNEQGGG
ncbi:MAG: tryptophan synthase subunit alpha [Chloroflexi bacterium]|nr:tryptophan synthase subunit alpha [Chloroflexota bacterium]